ncbi:IS110 family transposase [Kribbella sancticallisti]|uniref:IS110 family transposase n=1 Tax=Kribbella sancticallisti TaxID=460087 RepID=UPI003CD09A74
MRGAGATVDIAAFPATKAGNTRTIAWIIRRTDVSVLAAVEGTSSHGASVTAALLEKGLEVAEVRPAPRSSHAHVGKSDALDAKAAARTALGRDYNRLARPRRTGRRAALRILLTSRSIIDQQRTANRNA